MHIRTSKVCCGFDKQVRMFSCAGLVWALLSGNAQAQTLITTCAELSDIRNNLSGTYNIQNAIDCSAFVFNPIDGFTGTLEGGGYPITGLNIEGRGLFGTTRNAIISNVRLEGIQVVPSTRSGTGALVGIATDTTITACSSSGTVTSLLDGVGGLVGRPQGPLTTITHSSSSANVFGCYDIGGLVGQLRNHARVQQSFSTGDVNRTNDCPREAWGVGGLIGLAFDSSIFNSWASGSVVGTAAVGGLVGALDVRSTLSSSYSTGDAAGLECGIFGAEGGCGGLIGWVGRGAYARDSFSTGAVSGDYPSGASIGSVEFGTWRPDEPLGPPQVDEIYYFDQSAPYPDIGFVDEGLEADSTPITDVAYFYEPTNPPMIEWDEVSVWSFCTGASFPSLIWEQYQCPPTTALEVMEELITDIEELIDISPETASVLIVKVNKAIEILEDGNYANDKAAVNKMVAFNNFVAAQRGKRISDEDADVLTAAGESIIAMIQNGEV